jgi:hypothetical protein
MAREVHKPLELHILLHLKVTIRVKFMAALVHRTHHNLIRRDLHILLNLTTPSNHHNPKLILSTIQQALNISTQTQVLHLELSTTIMAATPIRELTAEVVVARLAAIIITLILLIITNE